MDGRDDQHPILLTGAAKEHFRSFLRVMYPSVNDMDCMTDYDDWVGAVHLGTMWGFSQVRAWAIRVLSVSSGTNQSLLQDRLDLNQLLLTLDSLAVARLFSFEKR